MPVLSNRSAFWTAAAVALVALWASGAPSMVYPVYVAEWHLTPIVITSIFAVYPISLVVILIVFGGISDYVGRRATLLAGLAAIAVGVLLFAIAPDVGWLYAGRIFQGVGVGLAMAPASAAMVEFSGGSTARASSINAAATALGLALATIVGGALVQFAPFPTRFAYWVLLVIVLAVLIAVLFMPRATTTAEGRWRPRGLAVPQGLRLVFVTAALAMAAAFVIGAIFISLGSSIAKTLLKTDSAFVAGSIIAISAVVIGLTSVLARPVPPRIAIAIGGVANALGMAVLVASVVTSSLAVFIAAGVICGVGYGLLFLGGLGLINRNAPVHHRALILSAAYLVSYLAQGLVAVAVGLSATATGLAAGIDLWSTVIGGISVLATVLAVITAVRRGSSTTPSLDSTVRADRTPA